MKQLSFRNMVAAQPVKNPGAPRPAPRRATKTFVNTLEYELIAHLAQQQYVHDDGSIRFDRLLALPAADRIPALLNEFGVKRMHHLLLMLVKAFCFSLPLAKSKKLSETKMSAVACDLILAGQEDQLGLEDVILFFEGAKKGVYGPIKSLNYHYQLMSLFEQYRRQRREAFYKIQDVKEAELKALGPAERTAGEPRSLGELMKHEANVIALHQRMSG